MRFSPQLRLVIGAVLAGVGLVIYALLFVTPIPGDEIVALPVVFMGFKILFGRRRAKRYISRVEHAVYTWGIPLSVLALLLMLMYWKMSGGVLLSWWVPKF